MDISRQIKRTVLSGIENHALGQPAILLRYGKTERAHVATHAYDVIILLRCVDNVEPAVVDPLFEFFEERHFWRKRGKKLFRDQNWPARSRDQRSHKLRRIRINKRGARTFRAESG